MHTKLFAKKTAQTNKMKFKKSLISLLLISIKDCEYQSVSITYENISRKNHEYLLFAVIDAQLVECMYYHRKISERC